MSAGPPQDPNIRPKFHVKDLTCDENDPNFPFYDEVHGMYHLMYQDHVCIAPGHGPDIGHVVSRDFVHWAHLPVSIWNDKPYDNEAIFTGSASVIDGKPFIVYPGLCNKKDYPPSTDGGARDGCITGTNYAQAVPANPSDPLYTNWTKDKSASIDIATNPIVNGTSDDPSTAWKTPHGEWRLIGNAKAYGQNKSGVAPISTQRRSSQGSGTSSATRRCRRASARRSSSCLLSTQARQHPQVPSSRRTCTSVGTAHLAATGIV